MRMVKRWLHAVVQWNIFFLCLLSCLPAAAQHSGPLFSLIPAAETGIRFNNLISENDTLNILNEAYIYNGGGVGIADFNHDGLQDIYFAGNMVSNKLYLNKGNLKFQDITEIANVNGSGRWCTGVSVVDINSDGLPDIYVSATFRRDAGKRKNLLYINLGNNESGYPVFKEAAAAYGIDDTGYSTQGVFFDYDRDGDQDLFVVTNTLNDIKTPIRYRPKRTDGSAENTDRLYRNNGNGTFTNVSKDAGILIEGWGHAATVTDINRDGWPDIYVSNDFIANDILYVNNKNGTFTDRINDYFKHTSWYTMGTDIVDINNDGLVDVIALDMLPEDNLRKKRMLSGNDYYNYFNNKKFGYQHQYVRNTLQLNAGMGPDGHPVFSEIGYLAGIYQTDWSWDPLVADFDNDGYRDIIITNGLPRDVTDLDYISYNNGQTGAGIDASLALVDSLPVVKIPNYAFRNTGGLIFENKSAAWGLDNPSFSNGAAYADLDNDGDLDVVINNLNDVAFVYKNTLSENSRNKNHFLRLELQGDGTNTTGASIRLFYEGGRQQYYEHQPCRGYLSTVDARPHFGLGAITKIDSLLIQWADGKLQRLTNIKADQVLTLKHADAGMHAQEDKIQSNTLFVNVASRHGISFRHRENDFVDYNVQSTLPHKLSQLGPSIAVADIDNNGYDDFYIGGSAGIPGTFYLQDAGGNFRADTTSIRAAGYEGEEDMGTLLFDADNDGDPDLLAVSGSYEFQRYHSATQNRLYINDGKGHFTKSNNALPKKFTNGSCARAADFDGDGDLDLFIGGRSVSSSYPSAPESYLLENQGGKFVDVTRKYFPELSHLGMISDALWSDFNNDGRPDLVIAGEWMPISFYRNAPEGFVSENETSGISSHVGWWNSLVAGDFDNDGDIDYVAGNLGLNSAFRASAEEPMYLFAKDFDENGLMDPLVFCYMKSPDGSRKAYPMHAREDMVSQMLFIRKKYPDYKSYGLASLTDLLSMEDQQTALMFKATDMHSSYIENLGNSHFKITPLALEAQAAPVFGMIAEDVDHDSKLDLLMVGNDFGMDPSTGRHDAFMGLYMKGDGAGSFTPVPLERSGFFVPSDAKAFAYIQGANGEQLFIATQNQDSLKVYAAVTSSDRRLSWTPLEPGDRYAELIMKNNKKRRVEFYYGSTYLSQSSGKLVTGPEVVNIFITDAQGKKRKIPLR